MNGALLVEVTALESGLSLVPREAHLHKHLDFSVIGGLEGVILNPLLSRVLEQLPVSLVHVSYLGILRIIRLRRAHESLQRDEGCADCQSRGPFILQNIEADSSCL